MSEPVRGGIRVSRRALVDIVRPAVAGSYGVTGFVADGIGERLLGLLGIREPGIDISIENGLHIDLHLTVAFGLPVAEVVRQAESAVRYAVGRATGHEIERLTFHVGGMSYASPPPAEPDAVVAAQAAADAVPTGVPEDGTPQ